jgi:hypothetical protein
MLPERKKGRSQRAALPLSGLGPSVRAELVIASGGMQYRRSDNPGPGNRSPKQSTMRHWITSFLLLTDIDAIWPWRRFSARTNHDSSLLSLRVWARRRRAERLGSPGRPARRATACPRPRHGSRSRPAGMNCARWMRASAMISMPLGCRVGATFSRSGPFRKAPPPREAFSVGITTETLGTPAVDTEGPCARLSAPQDRLWDSGYLQSIAR